MTEYENLLKMINEEIDKTVKINRQWQRSGMTVTPDFYSDDNVTQRERKKIITEFNRLYDAFSKIGNNQIYSVKGWRRWVQNYEVFSVKKRKPLGVKVDFGTTYPENLILLQDSPSFEFSKLPEYSLETEIHSKSTMDPVKIEDLDARIEKSIELMEKKEIEANLFNLMVPLRTKLSKGSAGIEVSKEELIENVKGLLTRGKTFKVVTKDF
jgi:hypothetical protein